MVNKMDEVGVEDLEREIAPSSCDCLRNISSLCFSDKSSHRTFLMKKPKTDYEGLDVESK